MRYCVNSRQPKEVLELADELLVREDDIAILIDLCVEWPNKTIIYQVDELFVNSDNAKKYQEFDNLVFEIKDLSEYSFYSENGYKWYWKFAVTNYFELQHLVRLNPAYIRIAAPLSFDLPSVKKIVGEISLRLGANGGTESYFPNMNTLYCSWLRPEDVKVYDDYITVLDFVSNTLAQEANLLKIYKSGEWEGNLGLLLTMLGRNIDNRAIPENFGPVRATCRQECMRTGSCHFCSNAIEFATHIRKKHIQEREAQE